MGGHPAGLSAEFDGPIVFPVDPSHTYSLSVAGSADMDAVFARADMSLVNSTVPEPGLVPLLLPGLAGLIAIRRRFKR